MRANNNKGGEFVRKTDVPVVSVCGNNNNVEVEINVIKTSPKISVVTIITIVIIVVASVLAVSFCCPELLDDYVRLLISKAIGS